MSRIRIQKPKHKGGKTVHRYTMELNKEFSEEKIQMPKKYIHTVCVFTILSHQGIVN